MREHPYPDETPSSVITRWAAHGRIDSAYDRQFPKQDLALSPVLMGKMRGAGASAALIQSLSEGLFSRWPMAAVQDLSQSHIEADWVGKGCESCLAEDVAAGRDHYIRQEWRLAWRVSCPRHRHALVDLKAAELVPVLVDGVRQYRIRYLRELDQTRDPFRRFRGRGGGRNSSISLLGSCLESDIHAALRGAGLPDHWCLGRNWPTARSVLLDLSDLLLTRARGGSERLISHVVDDWVSLEATTRFARGCFSSIGTFWQRRLLEGCARILIDPDRYNHLYEGQRLNVHTDLAYGRIGQNRARSALGRLATSDLLSLLLAYAGEKAIMDLEPRIRTWPTRLTNRVASAASVALYIA